MNRGIEYFQQAIAKDPTYALAYAGLADCYRGLGYYGFVRPKETYPRAKEAALKALEIDDTLAEAHTSLSGIMTDYDWDWAGAKTELQRAIALNPNYATAHEWYGALLGQIGSGEEGIAEDKRALELDPLSLVINLNLAVGFNYVRQYDQAIEQLRKTIELDPNFALAHIILGFAYVQKSMYNEATSEYEKALTISSGNTLALAYLGHSYARSGRRADAAKLLNQLNDLSKRNYVPAQREAFVYIGLGEREKAFEWLEKAYEERSIGVTGISANPVYDPLRSDPRFQDLLRRMNLQP